MHWTNERRILRILSCRAAESPRDTIFRHLLTYAADGEYSHGLVGRHAVREKRLENIDAESQGHNGLAAWTHYHALDPQPDERQEGSEGLHNIRIIRPRFLNHAAELGVAVSPYLSRDTEKYSELI